MPIPLAVIGGAMAGVGALSKLIAGFSQKRQAHKINRSNPFPTEKANPLFAKNAALAEQMGQVGLPQEQYNQAQQGFQRNQTGALRQFGRTPNRGGLASIVRAGNDAQLGLDVADANARQGNQRFAMGQRAQLAQEQNRVFDWNSRTPFLQRLAQSEALRGASMQNKWGGLNDLTSIGSMMMMNGQQNGQQADPSIANIPSMATNPLYLQKQFKPNLYPKI